MKFSDIKIGETSVEVIRGQIWGTCKVLWMEKNGVVVVEETRVKNNKRNRHYINSRWLKESDELRETS